MASDRDHTQKQLGLAERPMTYNAEIYALTGIPTGDALPAYTQTQTSPPRISFAPTSPARLTDLSMAELLELTETERGIYYSEAQETYQEAIENNKNKLKRWEQSMLLTDGHMPTPTDYDKKIQHLLGKLPAIDFDDGEPSKKVPLKYLFPTSSENKDKCGLYLILNGCSLENVVLLSGIQWLMGKRDALLLQQKATGEAIQTSTSLPPQEDIVELTPQKALETLLIQYLQIDKGKTNTIINDVQYNKMRLKVCLMHALKHRGVLLSTWDETIYANLIAPITGEKTDNLRKGINKHQLTIKPYNVNLNDLSAEYIKKNPSKDEHAMTANDFEGLWMQPYKLINELIDTMDDLSPLRGKNA